MTTEINVVTDAKRRERTSTSHTYMNSSEAPIAADASHAAVCVQNAIPISCVIFMVC